MKHYKGRIIGIKPGHFKTLLTIELPEVIQWENGGRFYRKLAITAHNEQAQPLDLGMAVEFDYDEEQHRVNVHALAETDNEQAMNALTAAYDRKSAAWDAYIAAANDQAFYSTDNRQVSDLFKTWQELDDDYQLLIQEYVTQFGEAAWQAWLEKDS